MSYTVTKLINDAYYASGIVSREFQTVNGTQLIDGLGFLNDILADKTVQKDMIPYFLKYTFFAQAGVEVYFIPDLEQAETLVFYLGSVRYQMAPTPRKEYFGSSRAMNITSLPFQWHLERCVGGANLYMYFSPDTNYPIELWGMFRLGQVSINQDLESEGTNANLGILTSNGTGELLEDELVINNVQVIGNFADAANLVNYINNSNLYGFVSAGVVGTQFILNDAQNTIIRVTTIGGVNPADGVTFSDFSTTGLPKISTFVPTKLDRFYISYLKYALAQRICVEFNVVVPPGVTGQLNQYQDWISKRSAPLDLSMQKISTLSNQVAISYPVVNLSNGWIA